MKIKTLGKNTRPVMICIPGMFCDYTSVLPFAEYLAEDFFGGTTGTTLFVPPPK